MKRGFLLKTSKKSEPASSDRSHGVRGKSNSSTDKGWGKNNSSASKGWGGSWGSGSSSGKGWPKYSPPPPPSLKSKEQSSQKKELSSPSSVSGPFLPKNLGSPKAALNEWYVKKYKKFTHYPKVCYASWDNGGPPHDKRFTSVFRCPLTGEEFMSGSFGAEGSFVTVEENVVGMGTGADTGIDENNRIQVVWHRQKNHAEHAAAARALDCYSFREGGGLKHMSYNLCTEDPYLANADQLKMKLPVSAPESLFTDDIMIQVEPLDNAEEKVQEDVNMDDDDMFRCDYNKLRKTHAVVKKG